MLRVRATPIRTITARRSLSPHSFTRSPIGLPYGGLPQGEGYGLTVFGLGQRGWIRFALFAGGERVHDRRDLGLLYRTTVPFWPKPVSAFGLSKITTVIERLHMLT